MVCFVALRCTTPISLGCVKHPLFAARVFSDLSVETTEPSCYPFPGVSQDPTLHNLPLCPMSSCQDAVSCWQSRQYIYPPARPARPSIHLISCTYTAIIYVLTTARSQCVLAKSFDPARIHIVFVVVLYCGCQLAGPRSDEVCEEDYPPPWHICPHAGFVCPVSLSPFRLVISLPAAVALLSLSLLP